MSSETRSYELKARAERQLQTRARIVEATVALHEELGPARTTIAEIARRAGVQRLTVYNHFPEDSELFAACQGRFLSDHPPPDFAAALAEPDPRARLRAALGALYASYRAREPMTVNVQRDRGLVPALDALMKRTADAQLAELAQALAVPFRAPDSSARRLQAIVALALDFWTWHRLKREGLDDAAAADLMADLVAVTAAAGPAGRR